MNETLKNENSIREYLLGRISDETRLAEFEELLFLDEDFCSLAELVEDALINDFVFGRLNETDSADFLKTLENNRERREKVALTKAIKAKAAAQTVDEKEAKPSFFESLRAFFQKPLNVGAFAVLLIAVVLISFFVLRKPSADELAELKTIYSRERPTETRLSEFDYAPLTVTRGAAEEREKNKLRIIENELRIAVEKSPSANTHHALGVFLLTQRKFDEAVDELEKAVKLNEKDAKIRNDLGSAYFEKAKTAPAEKKLETLAEALENFSQAIDSDANLLAALFNKSLCLQELRLYNQAKEAWNLYLEKDPNSGWADEARKNLERLEQLKSTAKTKEHVLEDFLAAYRMRDEETVWKINSQTREIVSGVWLPDQLSRRFIEAKIRGDDSQATESIEALKFIGNLEREKNADFFVAELADFYARTDAKQIENLRQAKNLLSQGYKISTDGDNETAKDLFIKASKVFADNGNVLERSIAEHWIAFSDGTLKNLDDSNRLFFRLKSEAIEKKYKWFQTVLDYRLSNNLYFQNNHSDSLKYLFSAEKSVSEIIDVCGQRNVYAELAAEYYEIGEMNKALDYIGRAILSENLYYESVKQNWRNQGNASEMLLKIPLPNTSLQFALEHSKVAGLIADKEYVFNSLDDVAFAYTAVNQYEKALQTTDERMRLAGEFGDDKVKKQSTAGVFLQKANINRLAGNYQMALADYEQAENLYKNFPELQVNRYKTHKGKLQCYRHLGQTQNLQNELEIVRILLEKYRSEIVEEENRNAFFDNEQRVSDIAVEFELANKNPSKAFEIAEEAKARSLLDFMQGAVLFEKSEIRFSTVTKNLSLTEIQKRMLPSVQIVEYAVLPDKIAVWIIENESFDYSETPIESEILEQKIGDYLQTLITEKDNSEKTKSLSNELYELLIAPILPKLDSQKQICFVPDKSLYRLPFAALFSIPKGKYLIEDSAIFYAPSSSIFVLASENARQKEIFKDESLLSIGNPKFDAAETPNLSDLPSAEIEVKEIAKFYRNNRQFIGENATKINVFNNLEAQNIFHFAGHYVTNEASAPNSKLLLAKQDGDLRLSEIAEKRLPKTKLVVLSACQTSLEKLYQGEGAIGVARSFLAIGSPSVLASGWKIDSEAAKDLMIAFHRNRKEKGLKNAEALRSAQIEMLKSENPRFRTPYFWSAFSLVGGFTNY